MPTSERGTAAKWVIRGLYERQRTIVRVTESIVRFQRDFFGHGPEHLRPLVLRDVADDIRLSESTVSRVTTRKYVRTPQGILSLKCFFGGGVRASNGDDDVTAESVREQIRRLVGAEDSRLPLSDQAITTRLEREYGVVIARRTVAARS